MDYFVKKFREDGYALDDTLLCAGAQTQAGSKILEGFVPLFSADCVERLREKGYECMGKTRVGEFGLDLLGETAADGALTNADGSLAGAGAAAVADGIAPFAVGVDLNGAPSRAAALAGVTQIKPTYGVVSRYGVIPCACSSETVCVTAKTAAKCAEILSVIAGHDAGDGTSLPQESYAFSEKGSVAGMKIAVLKEYAAQADAATNQKLQALAAKLQKGGAVVEAVAFPLAAAIQSAGFILLCGETCNNLSRYDGVKFGYRTPDYRDIDGLYTGSRTEGFGLLTKEVILYGSDVLSKNRYLSCYDKALRIRTAAIDACRALFAQYDLLLLPACGKTVYKKEEVDTACVFAESLFSALAGITGLPAITTAGVRLVADRLCENKLFIAAAAGEGAAE